MADDAAERAMKCPRCHDPDLKSPEHGGGPLSSWACARCGGGFVPEDGTSRLLEELNHTAGELRELAALFGGARLTCPGCRSRMSPLQLRGVTLDVCFGCGGLWVDKGDLEAVSAGRYIMPAPTDPLPRAVQSVAPSQSLVRVDERTLPRHIGRAVLAGVGSVGLVWTLIGILPLTSGFAGVAALAAAAGLSRRQAFDVLPRARRMMRWRGFFAPSASDDVGEAFSPESCVVVRRLRVGDRELPWVVLDLVDGEGRDLARLHGPMVPQRAWTEGPRYARALGVTVRFDVEPRADDELDEKEAEREDLPGFAKHDALRLTSDRAPANLRRLVLKGGDNVPLGAVLTEVPSRFSPTSIDAILAEHFVLEDALTGQRARLFSAVQLGRRATVVVGPDGKVLGHVDARRTLLGDTFAWSGPQGRRKIAARLGHGTPSATLRDGYGRELGVIEAPTTTLPNEPRSVSVRMHEGRMTGGARWGLLALMLHVALASAVDEL